MVVFHDALATFERAGGKPALASAASVVRKRKMTSFDGQKHQLAGSIGKETGGLLVKKKDEGEFKKPAVRESVLGLDALARQKRREQEEERKRKAEDRRRANVTVPQAKRHKEDAVIGVGGGDVRVSFGSSGHARERIYR